MNVLATRTLQLSNEHGDETDITLTIFHPLETERGDWKCGFQLTAPMSDKIRYGYGVDFLQALLGCLEVARGYIEHPVEERTHWQGMPHSGLPWHAEKPASYQLPDIPPPESAAEGLEVLTSRKLAYPDEGGAAGALILTVYLPFHAGDETWKCAFGFNPTERGLVRHGVGSDFIEALLNALALARAVYERMLPRGWLAPDTGDIFGPRYLPYNIGRAYWTEPATG